MLLGPPAWNRGKALGLAKPLGLCLLGCLLLSSCDRGRHAAKVPTPSNLSKQTIAAFASLPERPSPAQYFEKIRGIGRNLPPGQQHELVAWILGPHPAHIEASLWPYLVNATMDRLSLQKNPVPEFSLALVAIARDSARDGVCRDFSLQHMAPMLQPDNATDSFEKNPKIRRMLLPALLDAASKHQELFSGTAVQHLSILLKNRQRAVDAGEPSAQCPMPLSVDQFRPLVLSLCSDELACMPSRVMAIQVCAERGFTEALPTARKLALDQGKSTFARLGAIAAIGSLGNAEDKPVLEQLASQQNARLSKALVPALNRLSDRTINFQ